MVTKKYSRQILQASDHRAHRACQRREGQDQGDHLGCDADEYDDMLAHEIAEMVLVEIEKPVKPCSLQELHGARRICGGPFGSKEKLVEFLKPFLVADPVAQEENS